MTEKCMEKILFPFGAKSPKRIKHQDLATLLKIGRVSDGHIDLTPHFTSPLNQI